MRRLALLLPVLLALVVASPARAVGDDGPLAEITPRSWKTVALFLGGAATAFLAHESCHVVMNYALGSHPHIGPVTYLGFIPFFSISPSANCTASGSCYQDDGTRFGPGARGMYAIVIAGVQCQQVEDEIILSTEPRLRYQEAPFRKGLLAMNTGLAIGYAFSNWMNIEPPEGDLASNDRLLGKLPKGALAAAVFVPAVLDILRYLWPDSPWLPWVSRLSKGALIGFTFAL
jgi:hypothetical protein